MGLAGTSEGQSAADEPEDAQGCQVDDRPEPFVPQGHRGDRVVKDDKANQDPGEGRSGVPGQVEPVGSDDRQDQPQEYLVPVGHGQETQGDHSCRCNQRKSKAAFGHWPMLKRPRGRCHSDASSASSEARSAKSSTAELRSGICNLSTITG